MRARYRNLFLAFGLVAVAVMVLTMDMSYETLWANLRSAGLRLPLILLLWLVIYTLNNLSWWIIIRNGGRTDGLSFLRLLKYTVTGFSLNYVTPMGLMGGEPYRIMELTPLLGVERATASVILYVMMHILSHFLFWASAALLFFLLFPVSAEMGTVMALILLFSILAAHVFARGYRHGMAVACLQVFSRIPGLRKVARGLTERYRDRLEQIDRNISLLHGKSKTAFYASLLLEYLARLVNCAEVWLILNVLTQDVDFMSCILILAFSSLMANLLFFMPMQIGGREGGFALAVDSVNLAGGYGVYAALITRVRELFWILIGLALMKVGNLRRAPLLVDRRRIRAIAFDMGGTLDAPFRHWMEIYLQTYCQKMGLEITEEQFRPSYVACERRMDATPLVGPSDSLLRTQRVKCRLQLASLRDRGILSLSDAQVEEKALEAARLVTEYATSFIQKARPTLEALKERYTLLLVSNYYGNAATVARDGGIADLFTSITDSALEGVRKPDPELWRRAIERAGFSCSQVLVVGDSMKNDIRPALALGCQAVKGCAASESRPSDVASIRDLSELTSLLL